MAWERQSVRDRIRSRLRGFAGRVQAARAWENLRFPVDNGWRRLMGRYDEALADLNRAIELDPDDAGAFGRRGETYIALGNYDEALADLNRAIELDPAKAWAGSRSITRLKSASASSRRSLAR